jgi:hypothetical protein
MNIIQNMLAPKTPKLTENVNKYVKQNILALKPQHVSPKLSIECK